MALQRRESMPAVPAFNRNSRVSINGDLGFAPRTSINLTSHDPVFAQFFTTDEQKEIIQRARRDQNRNKNDVSFYKMNISSVSTNPVDQYLVEFFTLKLVIQLKVVIINEANSIWFVQFFV